MNNTALAYREEAVPPEQRPGFVPTILRKWTVVEVDRARIRASLHPDVMKKEGIWGSFDPRFKAFTNLIVGEGVEKVECRIFRWRDRVGVEESARRIGRKQGPFRWIPARFEHLIAYGVTLPLAELRTVIVAPGSIATIVEPPRPVFRGPDAEGTTDLCVASILGGAPLKILNVTTLSGRDPHRQPFPIGTSFLGIRNLP